MTLHNEIMNLPVNQLMEMSTVEETNKVLVYRMGHRDARHAASEHSLKYERYIEALVDIVGDHLADQIRKECGL